MVSASLGLIIFAIILVTIATVVFIVNAIAFLRISNTAAANLTGAIINNGTTFNYTNSYAATLTSSARTYYIVNAVFAGVFGAAWLILIIVAFLSFRRRSEVIADEIDVVDAGDGRRGRREVTTTTTEVTTLPAAPAAAVAAPTVTTITPVTPVVAQPGLSLQGVSVSGLQFQPQSTVTQYSATQQANGAYQVNLVSPQGNPVSPYGPVQTGQVYQQGFNPAQIPQQQFTQPQQPNTLFK